MDQAKDIPAGVPGRGIWLFRASRIESLLDPLLTLLDSNPPAAVLAPQTVIVAHPGMRQWLSGAIAGKRGEGGIVANLELMLPGAWLDRVAQSVLGPSRASAQPYRRELLRWRIHDALETLDDERVHAYLRGHDAPRRRFQLADRLARMFSQYLMYRPDWLDAWAAGRDPTRDAGFLVPLWQRLRATIGQPHRGERLAELVARLDGVNASDDDTPLHVFGLSHIAPGELAVLRAVARQRLVVFHVPDPCREFWAGMPSDRGRLRELAGRDPDSADTEAAFLQLDHPLLGSWGRIGQHFLLLLEDSEAAVDIRHHLDQREAAIEPVNRLQWLQEGIRRGQPGLPWPLGRVDAMAVRADGSLRVHACHTRLRELEVLRDALLLQLRENPRLRPSDIVVMAPDMGAYAPLVPAVFGEPGRAGGPLPYHLADVPIASAHPLFDAFARLLDLPRSRLTAPEVADLLALLPVARRFGLGEGDLETITHWLRDARVAWGLDGSFRQRFGVPPIETQTFAWGMDRLLAGYAMGQDAGPEVIQQEVAVLPDGSAVLPLEGVAGTRAEALGALDLALVELARWCALGGRSLRAGAWAQQLGERIAATLQVAPGDRAGGAAMDALLQSVHALAAEPRACRLDPPLAFEVVREFLHRKLADVPERQRFLMGGVTFCGMVPQRAIPFAVVAVLGLDDGVFPRADDGAGVDPIVKHRRLGDRDTRSDDRWLFLQTLMSARDALHLSYIGSDARDGKPRNPAAPLAELIAFLDPDPKPLPDEDGGRPIARAIARRPWFVRHALQPFDPRYRDGTDPALFAFRSALAQDGDGRRGEASAGVGESVAIEAAPGRRTAPLREVLAFFRHPAKDFLNRRMKLRLDALDDDRLRDSEPLDAAFERIDRVGRRVFFDAMAASSRDVPIDPPDWLRLGGLLPPGRPGAEAWRAQAEEVSELLEAARDHPLFADGLPPAIPVPLQLDIGTWRVEGELARVRAATGARWIVDVFPGKDENQLDFGHRIGLFLEWALLRLGDATAQPARLLALCSRGKGRWQEAVNRWDEAFVAADAMQRIDLLADLRRRVVVLLDRWWALQSDPRWYFPGTSWAAANAEPDAKSDKAASAWDGYRGHGERHRSAGYERLLAGDAGFGRGTPERALLDDVARDLLKAISLSSDPEPDA